MFRGVVFPLCLFACVLVAGERPVRANVPPFPVTECPQFPDTREGQIKRGVCAARKFAPLIESVKGSRRNYANQVCEAEIPCVIGVCQVARNVCKGLLDPQCNHGGIESPADGPAFRNAACRVPRADCATAPNAEEKKLCEEIRPHVPPEGVFDPGISSSIETVSPRYVPLAVLYSPPGKEGKVTYGSGSSLGVRQEMKISTGVGVTVAVDAPVASFNGEFMHTTSNGRAFEVRKTSTHSLSVKSQNDYIDHEKDMFLLWMNPQVSFERTLYPGNRSLVRAQQGTQDRRAPKTVIVSAYQLRDPSKLPDSIKPLFARWTREDYDNVLKLNPFTGGAWASDRFKFLEQIQIDGPVAEKDNHVEYHYLFEDESLSSVERSSRQSMFINVEFGAQLSFVVSIGVFVGGKFTYDLTQTQTTTNGTKQVASYDISSSTVGYTDIVDVYYDKLFGTFVFKSKAKVPNKAGAAMSGTVRMPNGQPAASQMVTMTFSDGTQRRLQTDANGVFRLYSPPTTTGNVAITTSAGTTTVAMGTSPELKGSATPPKYAPRPPKATVNAPQAPVYVPARPIKKPGR